MMVARPALLVFVNISSDDVPPLPIVAVPAVLASRNATKPFVILSMVARPALADLVKTKAPLLWMDASAAVLVLANVTVPTSLKISAFAALLELPNLSSSSLLMPMMPAPWTTMPAPLNRTTWVPLSKP
jgi:hypothetical protein